MNSPRWLTQNTATFYIVFKCPNSIACMTWIDECSCTSNNAGVYDDICTIKANTLSPELQILDCVIRYTDIVALLCTSQPNLSWHLGHWIFRPCNNAAIPNSTRTSFGRRPLWSQTREPFKMPRILALTPMYEMEMNGAKARKSRQQWFIKLDFIYLFWLRKKKKVLIYEQFLQPVHISLGYCLSRGYAH